MSDERRVLIDTVMAERRKGRMTGPTTIRILCECESGQWKEHRRNGIGNVPCAFCEEIVLAVDMHHPVLEDALPFILHPRDLGHH
jgi:hypothetical protein